MNRIKIVMAKYEGCDTRFAFESPYTNVKRGDEMIVETTHGHKFVTALTGIIEIDDCDIEQIGVFTPLKKVKLLIQPEIKKMMGEAVTAEIVKNIENQIDGLRF